MVKIGKEDKTFLSDRGNFLKQIQKNKNLSKEYYKHIFEHGVDKDGKLLVTRVIHELSELTKGKDNIVTDVGQHQMHTAKFYAFDRFNS